MSYRPCHNHSCNKCYRSKPRCGRTEEKYAEGVFSLNSGQNLGTDDLSISVAGSIADSGFQLGLFGGPSMVIAADVGSAPNAIFDVPSGSLIRSQAADQKLEKLEGSLFLTSDADIVSGQVQIVLLEKVETGPNAGQFRLRPDRILVSHTRNFVNGSPTELKVSKSLRGITLRKGHQYAFGYRFISATGNMDFSSSLSVSYRM